MVSTKNTSFDKLKSIFAEMQNAQNEENWSTVNAIKADIQDWFMGSASRNLDLQIAYLTEPDSFEKIWKSALEGAVHKFDEFLMNMFPDKRDLFVANSDVEKLLKDRDELINKVNEQSALINSYEEDIRKNIKEIQDKNDEICALNNHLGMADNEINEAENEINRQSEEIVRLKAAMFDLIDRGNKIMSNLIEKGDK